jgi:hypothetical protein
MRIDSKLEEIYFLTLEAEQSLMAYATSKASKEEPWFGRTDLSGLCKKASGYLAKKLDKMGFKSTVVLGQFDIPKAGGNGKELRIKHYWVEVIVNNNKIIADPTCRQFVKYLPQQSITQRIFKIPFVGTSKDWQSEAYTK